MAINSSPHKDQGNTALLLTPFIEGLREAGAQVELFYTNDLKIGPCLGDHACQIKAPGKCVQNDDMQWLLPKILEADAWVWATPVYDDGVTGPLKILMDRMVPGAQPFIELREGRLRHLPLGYGKPKKLVLVSNCGFPEIETFDPVVGHMNAFCANASVEFAGALLRPAGPILRAMLEKGAPVKDIIDAAREAGRQFGRDGAIGDSITRTVSRPIITQEAFLHAANQRARARRDEAGSAGKGPSKTAETMVMIKAGEFNLPADERVCHDPYAVRFISRETLDYMARYPEQLKVYVEQSERRTPGASNSIVARVRFFDEVTESSIRNGLEQLVILGAGYDTRAYRIEGLKNISVFEVDHPATQKVKREKVAEIFGSLPGYVTYVPVDMEFDNLGERLLESGYDRSRKTLFAMEGLLMYLPPPAVDEILSFIANNSGSGSAVVFDYIPSSVVDGTCKSEAGKNWRKFVADAGEPFQFGIEEGTIESFLARRGFTRLRNLASEDYRKAYFHGKNAGRVVNSLHSFAYAEV